MKKKPVYLHEISAVISTKYDTIIYTLSSNEVVLTSAEMLPGQSLGVAQPRPDNE